MMNECKPTGLHARNGEIHVGDMVRYDDGDFICFTARVVEEDGQFGFILFDGAFNEIRDCVLDPDLEDFGLDFEILENEPQQGGII